MWNHRQNQPKTQRSIHLQKCGTVINADTNAAINILKKVVPEAPLGDCGTVDIPTRIRTLDVKLL